MPIKQSRIDTSMFFPGMLTLEEMIRPFGHREPFQPKEGAGIGVAPTITPITPVINIVGASDSTFMEHPAPPAVGFSVEWDELKSKRQTRQERVENPNDPEQFVELEVITSFEVRNRMTGEQMKINVDRTRSSQGT
jgi:hypothetical protein